MSEYGVYNKEQQSDGTQFLPPPAPQPIFLPRMRDINSAMIDVAFFTQGVRDDKTVLRNALKYLAGVSLADMVAAGPAISAAEDKKGSIDGKRTIAMKCDDRLVAGIYAFLHFSPEINGDPSAIVHDGHRVLCMAVIKNISTQEDDE